MGIALVCGLVAGIGLMFLRESLNSSGKEAVWAMINNILFQDITAQGAESAIGIFYIIGQLFIRSLQLVIVPMVFTSISLAIGQISDTKTLGRISAKTIGCFLLCSFFALAMACVAGILVYNAGFFTAEVEGLSGTAGSTGANPLIVVLDIVPSNITSAFSSNTAVLSIVFLAVSVGLCMNVLGEEKTGTLKKLIEEVNDVVVVFLNYVVTKFGPFAIFVLLTRTFATYGINYLKPAFAYVVVTTILLIVFLFIGYPMVVALGARLNPVIFVKKITNVAVFGFSTSSSAATLPLNHKTCTEGFGVDQTIASFVLPLGMTINMNGTAIMQVIATVFIAGCAGYQVTFPQLIVVALLALIASAGTPAAPGAGAVILFTILSGVGFINDGALLAYSLILAINRPIEMLVTSLNVVGDAVTSIWVAKSEGLLDETKYNA
ncbi:MAG: dicarboxylate/amino acid:cation symporter [Lachnospiraceae bacterium]|nr:dicarboxylate/amino acid:cation symporter [Lachnospiraceae bacterium]